MSSTAIFVRSYEKDFPWLAYLLRSIQKYATGFSEIIVAIPEGQTLNLTAETVIHVHDSKPGYMAQQVDKLNADKHTEADYILHLDSDMCLTEPLHPDYFFRKGKPVWVTTNWADFENPSRSIEKKAWFHVMAKCCLEAPQMEFMRRCAVLVPRWIYGEFRQFIWDTHGLTMEQYVMSQPGREFSEYNCLGFYCWLKHRDVFHWHNTADGVPEWPWKQRWSWGGLTDEIRADIERDLA